MTLPELLVVIGIISLLAAILFPVFSKARDAALRISALSGIRQVNLAVAQYSSDSDDVCPPYFSGFDRASGKYQDPQAYWPQLVTPYIEKAGVGLGFRGQLLDYQLPRVFFDGTSTFLKQALGDFGYISSWGLSDEIADWTGPRGYVPSRIPASFSELSHPSSTFLLVETRDFFHGGKFSGDAIALAPDSYYGGADASVSTAGHFLGSDDFHNIPATGFGIVAYADSHVKSIRASAISTDEAAWRRTNDNVWP